MTEQRGKTYDYYTTRHLKVHSLLGQEYAVSSLPSENQHPQILLSLFTEDAAISNLHCLSCRCECPSFAAMHWARKLSLPYLEAFEVGPVLCNL